MSQVCIIMPVYLIRNFDHSPFYCNITIVVLCIDKSAILQQYIILKRISHITLSNIAALVSGEVDQLVNVSVACYSRTLGSAVNYEAGLQTHIFLQLYAAVQVDKPVLLRTLADVGLS